MEFVSERKTHWPEKTLEIEWFVSAQSSAVKEMGNIKGRGTWAWGGGLLGDMLLREQVESFVPSL